ncbi:MAG: phosphate ABC transporter substrate-binding protein PstS family protein [Pirellulales bacterium]|nr:phosphate ABC transporter substrate-binding protein PstS family protein [Pirellulales bacterium]
MMRHAITAGRLLKREKMLFPLSLLSTLCLVAGLATNDNDIVRQDSEYTGRPIDNAALRGGEAIPKIVFRGSTTVVPIAEAFAEHFRTEHPHVQILVDRTCSGDGAKALIQRQCNVALMSRFMTDKEFEAALAKGVHPVFHTLAMGALVVVVHPDNPVDGLSIDQVRKIYSGAITNWKEIGGHDERIRVLQRQSGSGARGFFHKWVMEQAPLGPAEQCDSNRAVQAEVARSHATIGYVGIEFLGGVKPLVLNGVEPTRATVANGQYPLIQPLYFVTDGFPPLGSDVYRLVTMQRSPDGCKMVVATGCIPIEEHARLTAHDAVRTIWPWLAVALGVIVLLGFFVTRAGQLNRRLAQSETQLRNVLDAASQVSIIATDLNGMIRVFNPGAERMLGYSADELVNKKTPAVIHLKSEMAKRSLELSDEYGKPIEGFEVFVHKARNEPHEEREWTYVRKDGQHIRVRLRVSAVCDQSREITGFLSTALDITDQKHAEEEARKAHEMTKTILAKAPFGVVVISTDRKIQWANDAAIRMAGVADSETICGKNCGEYLCPAQQDECPILDLGQTVDNSERIFRRNDGQESPILKTVTKVEMNGENVLLETFIDITEMKRTEAELQRALTESERLNRLMQGRETRLRELKSEVNSLLLLLNRLPVYSVDAISVSIENVETRVRSKNSLDDQIEAPGSSHQQTLESPGGDRLSELEEARENALSIAEDAEMARHIAQESQANLEVFRRFAEESSHGIGWADMQGRIIYVNPTLYRMLGEKSHEDAYGTPVTQYYDHETRKRLTEEIFPQILKGHQWSGELDLHGRNGTVVSTLNNLFVLFDEEGLPLHFANMLTDITDKKHAADELRQLNEHLEQQTILANEMATQAELASMAKSEFLANMSHEIRTPLNGIIGMTGLLLDTDLSDEQRRFAEAVKASSESLLCLIGDILDFSKIEAKKLELEFLDFDLRSMLEDFTATMAVKAHEKGLELVCGVEPDVPLLVRGDPGRLRQILNNLVGNALKFTQEGEVVIRVAVAQADETTSSAGKEVHLRFTVRDTGIGIPADKQSGLFQQFTQVDASTTRKFGGTGLGLAISKQLAEMMGGRIGVASEEGHGAEFWFTVRLEIQLEETCPEATHSEDLSGIRVLVVDDNTASREAMNAHLSVWGMHVTEAEDATVAFKAMCTAWEDNKPFRCAVIDMQMPGVDGESLGRAIKADPRLADVRIVLLTPLGSTCDAKRCVESGFETCLCKPPRYVDLKAVFIRALTRPDGATKIRHPVETNRTRRQARKLLAGRHARVLVAEDNLTNQQVALGILKRLGLSADAVADGAEAVTSLKSIPYDLVLMDVQMPEMDGLEATRRIRDSASDVLNHNIPIVAMTAHAMAGDREKCLEAGMNDYVAKPVEPEVLAMTLEKWLPSGEVLAPSKKVSCKKKHRADAETVVPAHAIWDSRAMLDRLMGDESLAATVIKGFLDDIPNQIEILTQFVEDGDVSRTERQAHAIKGAASNVGGEAMRETACEMEKAAKAGDLDAARIHLEELARRFELLRTEMNIHLYAKL